MAIKDIDITHMKTIPNFNSKPIDPVELLKELDAYLSFRLCCDTPSIPKSEILDIKKSIQAALEFTQ